MLTDFVEELRWRNMLHDSTPGADELLRTRRVRGYIGFDPTSDSLGVGNLVQVMTLLHFQRAGHQPIALVGGATGMVGDPSGKSAERNLLSAETLEQNLLGQRRQLERFLDFSPGPCAAEIVNNYDWIKDFTFLDFIRDVGKHFTVNYMMAKDSVKKRISGDDREGMSFTEFTYQLVQGYDFYWLWKNKGVPAADGRLGPVGQHRHGHRADPPQGAAARPSRSPPRSSPRPTAPSSARPRRATSGSTRRTTPRTSSTSSGSTPATRTRPRTFASSPSSPGRRSRRWSPSTGRRPICARCSARWREKSPAGFTTPRSWPPSRWPPRSSLAREP